MIFFEVASASSTLVADVFGVGVQHANPLDARHAVELFQQFRQPRAAVQVHAVVGGILGDDDEFPHAVGGEFVRLADHFFHRLRDVLAAHLRDGAVGAKAVAALADLHVGVVPRRDAEAGRVFQGPHRGGAKERPLFVAVLDGPVHDFGDVLAAEDADDLIDLRHGLQQQVLVALREAAGHHDGPDAALPLQFKHLTDDAERFLAGRFDEPAGVHHDHVGPLGVGLKSVTVLGRVCRASVQNRRCSSDSRD